MLLEQSAIVDAAIYDEVKAEFEAHQCVIISKKADITKLQKVVLNEARTAVNGRCCRSLSYWNC